MSFTYSRALVEASLRANYSGTDASAPSRSSPTPAPCLWHDKTMDASHLSQYGMTCEPLTDDRGAELLTWLLGDSRVRTSAAQDSEPGSTAPSRDYGARWREWWAKYDQDTYSWRTPQCLLLGGWERFSGTWPRSGSMRAGECFPLPHAERPIGASESGSLPTPSGTSNHGKNHVAGRLDEWGGSSNPWRGTEIGGISSPAFEEWVMGWPVQWTELTAFETDKFRLWRQQHSLNCSALTPTEPSSHNAQDE
jgi:hypothetical protein